MNLDIRANDKYKDSFFTKLFSEPERILSLYNALSQSRYPLDTPIEITTLEDVFFKGRYNDVSFIIEGKLVVLVEQQSSINPNMPTRLMIYLGKIYDKHIKGKQIYSTQLIKIPRPEFYVLYNGTDAYPDEKILNLSDAFFDLPEGHKSSGSLELTVRVLNINKGHNEPIVQKSAELDGYVDIIDEIRKNQKSGMNLDEAVIKAVRDCKNRDILADFLEKYGGEVISMLYAEWNLDEYGTVRWEEGKAEGILEGKAKGRAEGRAEGILEGILKTAKSMLQDGDKPEKISRCTGLPLEQVYQLQSSI